MQRLIIVLLIIGLVGFIIHKNTTPDPAATAQTLTPAQQEHAAITKMALESEAKAKQAAAVANRDAVADYEKSTGQ